MRCKNITVGYTVPRALTNRITLEKVRIYISGENLFEFTNGKIPVDPETPIEEDTYLQVKVEVKPWILSENNIDL